MAVDATTGDDRRDNKEADVQTQATRRNGRTSPLNEVLVEQAMHVGFVGCPLETPLRAVADLMSEHRVHCVVGFGDIADGDTRLWGLVSDIDVVSALAAGEDDVTAGAVASTEVVTVTPAESVRRAAELMRDHEVSHLLVLNGASDRPVGVISTLDVMRVSTGAR
jgi:CBS domain-containing protein